MEDSSASQPTLDDRISPHDPKKYTEATTNTNGSGTAAVGQHNEEDDDNPFQRKKKRAKTSAI